MNSHNATEYRPRPGWRKSWERGVDCVKCGQEFDCADFYPILLHEQTCQGKSEVGVDPSPGTSTTDSNPHSSGVKASRAESSSTFGGLVPGSEFDPGGGLTPIMFLSGLL